MIATLQALREVVSMAVLMAVIALAIVALDRRDRAMDEIDPDEEHDRC